MSETLTDLTELANRHAAECRLVFGPEIAFELLSVREQWAKALQQVRGPELARAVLAVTTRQFSELIDLASQPPQPPVGRPPGG